MRKYIGTKQVKAEPMTMGEAFIEGFLQRDKIPSEEEKNQKGYHVKYSGGYESWSPAEPFEEAYKCCDTFLERLEIEQAELSDKLEKLRAFIESPKFFDIVKDEYQRTLLLRQESQMHEYLETLNERIKLLKNELH